MLIYMALFGVVRLDYEALAGDANKDSEWSFGQILGLASWLPVLVDFAYIWWEGHKEALTGQMMSGFEAVSTKTMR